MVYTRCRVGHARLTLGYLLKDEELPKYQYCNTPLTIKHICLACPIYNVMRQRLLSGQTLKYLLCKTDPGKRLKKFYHKQI